MSGDERALRIAHFKIGGVEPDSPNGINHSVRALSRAQAELGHEVAVFCIAAAGEIPGVEVHAYPARDHSRVLGARMNDLLTRLSPLNMPRTLPPDLAAWKPDILHTHGVHTLQDIIVARHMAKLGIPYCVSPRGGLLMDSTPVQRIAKKLFMAALEKRHLERAVFIRALSPWDAASLSRWGITNTTVVIPNGVDPALLGRAATSVSETGSDAQGARVFAFLGRLAREKGLDLLVRGFARLERKDLQLLLAGPGRRRYRRELKSLVSSLGLGDRIRFMGPLYRSSKVDFLIAADVFVHTPRSDGFQGRFGRRPRWESRVSSRQTRMFSTTRMTRTGRGSSSRQTQPRSPWAWNGSWLCLPSSGRRWAVSPGISSPGISPGPLLRSG